MSFGCLWRKWPRTWEDFALVRGEWLFPERTERHWTPDFKKVEFWAFFCLCDLDYPVIFPINSWLYQLLPWLAVSTIGFLRFIFKGNCFIKKNIEHSFFFSFTSSMPLI